MELQLLQELKVDANGYLVFNNAHKIDISDVDTVNEIIVDDLHEHRLHLLSAAVFYSENFADLLAIYNNIVNPFYVPKGTILRIPDLTQIESKILAAQKDETKTFNRQSVQSVAKQTINSKSSNSSNAILDNGQIIFRKSNNR